MRFITACTESYLNMELFKFKFFGKIHFSELFPTTWSVIIFISYMALFVNQGLLVTASQQTDNGYDYNTVAAVLFTEVVKLLVSLLFYAKDRNIINLYADSRIHGKVMMLYFVPAFLYCLYNNLAFVNLSVFDPTTYYLLLQLRVVITGVLFQFLFRKKLSLKQWLSLVMLTAGCMIKQLPGAEPMVETASLSAVDKPLVKGAASLLTWNMLLIIIQVVCSCLAGVYNELLLKSSDTENCNIYIQNMFMYADSIVCNVVLLGWQGELAVLSDTAAINRLLDVKVFLVVLNNAAIGIVTSFFLRSLNSILKTFASALELMFTAVLAWLLFGIPVYMNTMLAIFVVSLAVLVYSQNPVVNVKPSKEAQFKEITSV